MKDEIEKFKKGMKDVRAPLQKVVGHKRRERHTKEKVRAIAKKMEKNRTKNWPKSKKGEDWFKKGMGQSARDNLPPGYSSRELDIHND